MAHTGSARDQLFASAGTNDITHIPQVGNYKQQHNGLIAYRPRGSPAIPDSTRDPTGGHYRIRPTLAP